MEHGHTSFNKQLCHLDCRSQTSETHVSISHDWSEVVPILKIRASILGLQHSCHERLAIIPVILARRLTVVILTLTVPDLRLEDFVNDLGNSIEWIITTIHARL
jgi:hypothetical protein